MYICQRCNKVSKPGAKVNKVVIQTRKKEYFDSKGKKVGTGFETVKEIGICEPCLNVQG